mmetsp:Transcript_70429/g.197530  ORF Transcript_70429/g.197530 Transcript_70429/m.197530 type:complete len:169 (-) Transcript_70429:38-544(-)
MSVDVVRPVVVLGPPRLPATARYQEPIGTTRATWGVWVTAHKAVVVSTSWRSSTASRRAALSAMPGGGPPPQWEQSGSTSQLTYSKSTMGKGTVDPEISLAFWKGVLRLLRAEQLRRVAPTAAASPRSGTGATLSIRFGADPELQLEDLDHDFLRRVAEVETLTGEFS